MAGGLKTLLPLVALGTLAGLAAAQALQDPTRPPTAAIEPASASPGAGNAASGFQAVIRRPGHKPVAVINGQMVELGGKLNDATLVKLSESEAVLQGPSGKEVLHLTPAAEKHAKQKPSSDKGAAKGVAKGADKAMRQPSPTKAEHD